MGFIFFHQNYKKNPTPNPQQQPKNQPTNQKMKKTAHNRPTDYWILYFGKDNVSFAMHHIFL